MWTELFAQYVTLTRYILSRASSDNIRLWNASEGAETDMSGKTRSGVPFKIIPGHHGGIISQMGACLWGIFCLHPPSHGSEAMEGERLTFVSHSD